MATACNDSAEIAALQVRDDDEERGVNIAAINASFGGGRLSASGPAAIQSAGTPG